MKKIMIITPLLLITSCALLQRDSTLEAKLNDIRLLSYTAASIGTSMAIKENPEWKPKFEAAYTNLTSLLDSGIITGPYLRQIISDLPIKELKSENARIAIEGATLLYDVSVGTKLDIEKAPYVKAAAMGIRDGLRVGLGK